MSGAGAVAMDLRMLFPILAALAAQLAAPPTAPESLARGRAIAFAEALESGAALPDASPRLVLRSYFRPRYDWKDSNPAELRAALAGCRRGEAWAYIYGPRMQLVALRYHCPSDPQSVRWPVLEQEIDDGQITRAWVATGPRELERAKVRDSRPQSPRDSTFAADRAAALAAVSALQAGRTILPNARPGLNISYRDHIASKWSPTASAPMLGGLLAGCRAGPYESEPRRWLGSRLAIVTFACPADRKPHPEMAILLELLDGRVQSLRLEAGPPPAPAVIRPAQ